MPKVSLARLVYEACLRAPAQAG
ncbi:hypothetical protein STPH1_5056 [Streptomyces sp. OM5714]|nr:hypothetical protein STPH1_5056 [Streptomyces sp. OM5714]